MSLNWSGLMITPTEARNLAVLAAPPPVPEWDAAEWVTDINDGITLAAKSGMYSMLWIDDALPEEHYKALAQLVRNHGYDVTLVDGEHHQYLRISWETVNDHS